MNCQSQTLRGRFAFNVLTVLGMAACLAACTSSTLNVPRGLPELNTSQANNASRTLTPDPQGEVIGNGNVRVTLLVPKTIPGNAAEVAGELRNGAVMAMQDFGNNSIQLVIKDTKGQAAESQLKASEAISEGSSLVIGPLFAANVSAAAGMTLPANVVMLSFSTDSSVARRGVYLISYTPEDDTRQMIAYASSINRRSITAFLPRNAEGFLREKVLREMAGSAGIRLNILKYDRTADGVQAVITENAATVQASDSIYIPEGGPIPNIILTGLQRNGIAISQKQVLGSGNWESVKATDPAVAGAIYPGRDTSKFENFATRYQTSFGALPGVQAALAYDAVVLAYQMTRLQGSGNHFAPENFESNRGFQGVNGIFRIRASGTTQHGLAIYQIRDGKGQVIKPAPSSFARGS